jgi:hypothetical protein
MDGRTVGGSATGDQTMLLNVNGASPIEAKNGAVTLIE